MWHNFTYDSVGSTNIIARERILKQENHPFEYHDALQQTQGVGRMDRQWQSPSGGNLYVSFIMPLPHQKQSHAFQISFVAGIALIEAINIIYSCDDLWLKWPNDLIYQQSQKIAGILCEKCNDDMIIGCGVNISTAPDIEAQDSYNLHSIYNEYQRADILALFADKLLHYYRLWCDNDDFKPILDIYRQYNLKTGDNFTTTIDGVKQQVIFVGFHDDGALVINDNNGQQHILYN